MGKTNKKSINILIILVSIAVLIWANALKTPEKKKAKRNTDQFKLTREKQKVIELIKQQSQREPWSAKSTFRSWGRTPFYNKTELAKLNPPKRQITVEIVPEVEELAPPEEPEPELKGIYQNGDSIQALINDEILQVGDTFDEYKVLKIESNHVLINDGEETKALIIEPF